MSGKGAVLALGLVWAALQAGMAQGLTLGEHLALRGYTGKAFGQVMAENLGLKSLHVLTNNTSICTALVGAMGASFLDLQGQRRLQITTFATPDEVPPLRPGEEAVALIFGGQASPEVNYGLTKNSLRALAEANYQGAIFFHLRVWGPGFVAKAAQEDPVIARYLQGKRNLFTATYDPQANVVRVWRAALQEGRQVNAEELVRLQPNPTWEGLLKRT
ncbi:MAG: hypothetical protein ACK4ZX_07700, partial [Thermus sp.]